MSHWVWLTGCASLGVAHWVCPSRCTSLGVFHWVWLTGCALLGVAHLVWLTEYGSLGLPYWVWLTGCGSLLYDALLTTHSTTHIHLCTCLLHYRDLLSSVNDKRTLISSLELAKDVGSAEALLARHKEMKVALTSTLSTIICLHVD